MKNPSIFVLHAQNGAQYLNATSVPFSAVTVIAPLTKKMLTEFFWLYFSFAV